MSLRLIASCATDRRQVVLSLPPATLSKLKQAAAARGLPVEKLIELYLNGYADGLTKRG